MSSESSPPPNSAVPPASPSSSGSSSNITPPPIQSQRQQPNQTTNAPPPSTPSSSPPPSPSPAAPPPQLQSPPPPSLPPPSPPAPVLPSPPSLPPLPTPPPTLNSSPPPILPPPPPSKASPPSTAFPNPPLPPPVSPSPPPPPPITIPSPPTFVSPPPSTVKSPNSSPPSPSLSPPPAVSSHPPPSLIPPPDSIVSPPPIPTSHLPPSPPTPQGNMSTGTAPTGSLVPKIPTEKPTARSTTPGPNITAATTSRDGGGIKGGVVVAIGVVGFLALSLMVLGVWFAQKRKKKDGAFNIGYRMPSPSSVSSQNSGSSFLRNQHSLYSPQRSAHLAGSTSGNNFMYSSEAGGIGNSKIWFTYEELAAATKGFSEINLLGEGGFGCVYKGVLADGREVAVKQLKAGGGQGEREFRAEVEIISRIHHRHLVSLVGYCISEYQRILVYDYVPNNTLHYHLHNEDRPVMNWATRIKVAAGAARGIAYLHEDCNPRIIHRDIKSANILLDNNFEAQVADFGLAKLAMELDGQTHVSTRVMGTFGYMAPEYATTGKLNEKSDVFSFGVVLLELITGRMPVDASQPLGDESLVEWARPLLSQALENENFEELVDPRLGKNFVETEMFGMIEAAAASVRHLASKRPRMSQVVRALDSIGEISDITNGMKPGQSQIFYSRNQSAQIRMFQRMAFGSQEYSSSDFLGSSQSSWKS